MVTIIKTHFIEFAALALFLTKIREKKFQWSIWVVSRSFSNEKVKCLVYHFFSGTVNQTIPTQYTFSRRTNVIIQFRQVERY